MPGLRDVASALESYQGRYECLDAFVDDIDELRLDTLGLGIRSLANQPRPVIETWVDGRRLSIELFSEEGIARFRPLGQGPPSQGSQTVGFGVALGGALGAAVGAASAKKEG